MRAKARDIFGTLLGGAMAGAGNYMQQQYEQKSKLQEEERQDERKKTSAEFLTKLLDLPLTQDSRKNIEQQFGTIFGIGIQPQEYYNNKPVSSLNKFEQHQFMSATNPEYKAEYDKGQTEKAEDRTNQTERDQLSLDTAKINNQVARLKLKDDTGPKKEAKLWLDNADHYDKGIMKDEKILNNDKATPEERNKAAESIKGNYTERNIRLARSIIDASETSIDKLSTLAQELVDKAGLSKEEAVKLIFSQTEVGKNILKERAKKQQEEGIKNDSPWPNNNQGPSMTPAPANLGPVSDKDIYKGKLK